MRVRSVVLGVAVTLLAAGGSAAPAWAVPSGTVDQGAGQADPTSDCSIVFDLVYVADVPGVTSADVTVLGTAGATTADVSGGPRSYTITVSGMAQSGDVIVTVPGTTSVDNTVTWDAPAPGTCDAPVAAGVAPPIPAWVQAYGRASKDATCLAGWSPSWQKWAEPVTGGWVCTRGIPSLGR